MLESKLSVGHIEKLCSLSIFAHFLSGFAMKKKRMSAVEADLMDKNLGQTVLPNWWQMSAKLWNIQALLTLYVFIW